MSCKIKKEGKFEQGMRVQGSLTNSFKFEAQFFSRFRNGEGIRKKNKTVVDDNSTLKGPHSATKKL